MSVYNRVYSAFSELDGLPDKISKIDDLLRTVVSTLENLREELSGEAADSLNDVVMLIDVIRDKLF